MSGPQNQTTAGRLHGMAGVGGSAMSATGYEIGTERWLLHRILLAVEALTKEVHLLRVERETNDAQ